MPVYRVCFLNQISRDSGFFRCRQRSVVIRSARSAERAMQAAQKRFERPEGVGDWHIHAGPIEIEEINLEAKPTKPLVQSRQYFAGPRRPLPYCLTRASVLCHKT